MHVWTCVFVAFMVLKEIITSHKNIFTVSADFFIDQEGLYDLKEWFK